MTDDSVREEVEDIQSELQELHQTVQNQFDNSPVRERLARAERIRIGTSIAVVTIYITIITTFVDRELPTVYQCVVGQNVPLCVLSIQAILSSFILVLKVTTMTTRPIFDNEEKIFKINIKTIEKIGDYWLPAAFMPIFLFTTISGVAFFLFRGSSHVIGTASAIILEFLLFVTVGRAYAAAHESRMRDIQTSDTISRLVVGGGTESSRFTIKNDNIKDIDEEELKFEVNAPEGVELHFPQAYSSPDDPRYTYMKSVPAGESKRVSFSVDSNETFLPGETAEVEVSIYHNGEELDTTSIEIS